MIVVTGGTKGIGRAIVRKFASEGHAVATCARKLLDLVALQKEIKGEFGVDVFVQSGDMAQKEDVKTFVEFIERIGQPVDILINNTGVFLPGLIIEEPEGALEQQIETNLYSAYYLTRGLLPLMLTNKNGHIFNIASIASFMAYSNGGSYAISKHALLGLSRGLRDELKDKNIRVSTVMPGATYTASWEGVPIEEERLMPAEDIAEVVFSSWSLTPRSVVEDIVIRPQLGDL